MESISGGNQESGPSWPEPTREELEEELRGLEIWLAIQEPGLDAAMGQLTTRINKFISDKERAKEIRKKLGLPPEA